MSSQGKYQGERLSFFKLFSEKGFKLVVPIIQRDYAQGRTTDATNEVRNEFVDALYNYLEEGVANRDLDFVYGTLRRPSDPKSKEPVCFIPLDGQQRLTTLFLLHWYLYQISDDKELKDEFISHVRKNTKSLFTYETRQSSTEFCDCLVNTELDLKRLKSIPGGEPSLSATIENQRWFYRNWVNDPTIMSMLVMLDTLHEKFQGRADFFPLLLSKDNPVITFVFLDLDEYKLTDDLYIKMNSRGLPLSKFENLKAKLEQHLGQFDSEAEPLRSRKFVLNLSDTEQEVDLKKYFSHNIDTKWTTLFWQYAKGEKNPRVIDNYIANFMRVVITGEYAKAVTSLNNKNQSDDTFDLLYDGKYKGDKSNDISYSKYEASGALTPEAMLAVVDAMDVLYNGTACIKHWMDKNYTFYFDEESIFQKVIHHNLTRPERLQFYAYIQYLQRYSCSNPEGINDWMRVIHNLTNPDNTITDSNYELSLGIKEIDKLLPHAPEILSYLKTFPTIGRFARHQIFEEVVKAYLFDNDDWRKALEKTEKHNYFQGQIGFILDFAGIVEMFQNDKEQIMAAQSLVWTDEESIKYLDIFKNYARIASFVFLLDEKREHRINDQSFCFERAVLCEGDYLMEWSADSEWYNLLSTETVQKNVKRDLSWRRLLRLIETRKDADNTTMNRQRLVKNVFDKIGHSTDIVGRLEQICAQASLDFGWRSCLVESSQLWEYSNKGFMHFSSDEENILILGNWYLNMYHVELFTYYLWLKKFQDQVLIDDQEVEYSAQKCSDVIPDIHVGDFKYRHRTYVIEIVDATKGYEFHGYKIYFYDHNTERFEYPEEILNILQNQGFDKSEDEEDNSFIKACVDVEKTYKATVALTDALAALKVK